VHDRRLGRIQSQAGQPGEQLFEHDLLQPVPLEYSVGRLTCGSAAAVAFGLGPSQVLFTLVYVIVRFVLGLLVVLFRRDLSKDAELLVLRHENAVLRRQIPHVRHEPPDRAWLAALSRLIPRHHWAHVFAVTRARVLAWHRRLVARKWTYPQSPRRGRPPTAAAIKKLVVAMARANPVGFQNSATGLDLGVYAAGSYSLMRPPRTARRLIRSWVRSAAGWSGRGGRSWRLRWGRRPL
jgi:hypothetical protein